MVYARGSRKDEEQCREQDRWELEVETAVGSYNDARPSQLYDLRCRGHRNKYASTLER